MNDLKNFSYHISLTTELRGFILQWKASFSIFLEYEKSKTHFVLLFRDTTFFLINTVYLNTRVFIREKMK